LTSVSLAFGQEDVLHLPLLLSKWGYKAYLLVVTPGNIFFAGWQSRFFLPSQFLLLVFPLSAVAKIHFKKKNPPCKLSSLGPCFYSPSSLYAGCIALGLLYLLSPKKIVKKKIPLKTPIKTKKYYCNPI
jgi:hypothetical protein